MGNIIKFMLIERRFFMKKKIIAMLTVICLLSMLFSISTFASDIDTVQSENHHSR